MQGICTFVEDLLSNHSNHLFAEDGKAKINYKQVAPPERQLVDLSRDSEQSKTQNSMAKNVLE